MNAEVLIIGGGVMGLSIARELHKKGVSRITIVERGEIGKEASYAAAGMLAPQAEADKADDFFHFCTQSNALYPNFAQALSDETGVDIELDRSGTLYLAFTEEDAVEILHRYDWQTRAGLEVKLLSKEETRKAEPFVSPDVRESLFFPNDLQVENRKLLLALQKYSELNGIEIRAQIGIKNLLIEAGQITGAETASEKFYADKVVLATGAWTSFIKLGNTTLPVSIKPIRGQMISFQTTKRLFQRVIYSPRGYIVPRADGRVLSGATVEDAGFNNAVTDAGINSLRKTALEIAPTLGNFEIGEKWAGLRPFAADGLPVLGELAGFENLFAATAHYRNGILLAPLTAKILAEKIVENKYSDYLRIFSPNRFRAVGNR